MTETARTLTDIDADVMEKANECVAQFRWNNDNRWHLFVAEAIQSARNEERERCAHRADVARFMSYPPHEHPERIATAIREGK